jgi:hypothetical protein
MGFNDQLRNSDGDPIMGLAQWLGRKVRNHDPMLTVDAGRNFRGHTYSTAPSKMNVSIVAEGVEFPVVLYELADGRTIELQVREVRPQAYAKAKRVAVSA